MKEIESFGLSGFVSDEVRNRIETQKSQMKDELSLINEINVTLMKLVREIPTEDSQKNVIACVLGNRLLQSLQACIVLIEYRFHAEVFTIIRNMQETYLALATNLKNHETFELMCWRDEKKFKDSLLEQMKTSPIIAEAYQNFIPDGEASKIERERQYIRRLSQAGLTTATAKKYVPNIDASSMYKYTKEENYSQQVYLDYRMSSNLYAHVSLNSILIHYKVSDEIRTIMFSGANREETRRAIHDAVLTAIYFADRIDTECLDKKNQGILVPFAQKAVAKFLEWGVTQKAPDTFYQKKKEGK